MIHVALDTSFLISFADPNRPNHKVALDYFRHCVSNKIPMWISTIVAGEFQVGQPFTDLPLQNFRIQPYNLPHALRAGDLLKALNSQKDSGRTEVRRVVINDVKILAQALEEKIPVILSEDESTLAKLARRARDLDEHMPRVLLLSAGFTPGRLANPNQDELPLPETGISPSAPAHEL
jgi:predicted nucleic acid-binding protein